MIHGGSNHSTNTEGRSLPEGIRAILFDLDGTLVDFEWDLAGAVRDVLSVLHAAGIPQDKVKSRRYSTLMLEAMQLAPLHNVAPEAVRKSIGEIYDRYDDEAVQKWILKAGAKEFIERSRGKGIQVGLVSNIGRKNLAPALNRLGLDGSFDTAVCRDDVKLFKPDPEGINLAISRLGAQKNETLYIGDSLDDVNAARNAGIMVIIISNGEHSTDEIRASSPDGIIDSYFQLLA